MDLLSGKYLNHEICAFSNDWLIVYDGRYNYMLFDSAHSENIRRYCKGWMPTNNIDRGSKDIEFYSTFDNAVDNLIKVVANNGFLVEF